MSVVFTDPLSASGKEETDSDSIRRTSALRTGSGDLWLDSVGGQGFQGLPPSSKYADCPAGGGFWSTVSRRMVVLSSDEQEHPLPFHGSGTNVVATGFGGSNDGRRPP